MKICKKNPNILEPHHFNEVQEPANKAVVPSDLGILLTKIESVFDGFTADEWKNFILMFSIYDLNDILPSSILECYRYFVIACRCIFNRTINTSNLHIADNYLMKFCKTFEELYGKSHTQYTSPQTSQELYHGYGASLWILVISVGTVSSNINLLLVF